MLKSKILKLLTVIGIIATMATAQEEEERWALFATINTQLDMPLFWGGNKITNLEFVNGTLPNGLTLNTTADEISGIPTKLGTFEFLLKGIGKMKGLICDDENCQEVEVEQPLLISVELFITEQAPKLVASLTGKNIDWEFPTAYTIGRNSGGIMFVATGAAPISFSLESGALPDGFEFSEGEVVEELGLWLYHISGVPSEVGKFEFTIKATNAHGSTTQKFEIEVFGVEPKIISDALPTFTLGKDSAIWSAVLVMGEDVKLSYEGTLPKGLYIRAGSGAWGWDEIEIWGTPTEAGEFPITITATNKHGTDTKVLMLRVIDPNSTAIKNTPTRKTTAVSFAGIRNGQINLNLQAGNYTAELYNLQGRLVGRADINATTGINATGLRTDNLGRGVFILNVKRAGNSVLRQKISVR